MFNKRICAGMLAVAVAIVGCDKTTVEGPADKKLTVVKPADVTIKRGDTDKIAVTVARSNFSGTVKAEFNNLPSGVTLEDTSGDIEGNQRTFVLKASDTAALVDNHVATISIKGPNSMTATEEFRITVKDKG